MESRASNENKTAGERQVKWPLTWQQWRSAYKHKALFNHPFSELSSLVSRYNLQILSLNHFYPRPLIPCFRGLRVDLLFAQLCCHFKILKLNHLPPEIKLKIKQIILFTLMSFQYTEPSEHKIYFEECVWPYNETICFSNYLIFVSWRVKKNTGLEWLGDE